MSTESPLLTEVLSEVTVGEPSAWKALQVFPLVHPTGLALCANEGETAGWR